MTNLEGQTLGRYQLIERLGRGGMADVYKGFQPGLERYVAVKVLHPHLAEDQTFIERFRREARAVAALHHPNIVQVFDFDVQSELTFMVMEYIEGGQTLKERLAALGGRDERFPLPHTIDIVAKVADALDYAHRQGMIHRDIKPANILLPTVDRPLLSDFGIARIIGQRGLTAEGATIGTPAYMAPEQGKGEQASERSDIYALGIVLYEMIAGQPPYDADTPYAIIMKHIHNPLPSPRQLAPFLPAEVEQVVLKALAKNPDDRYRTAGDMRDALRRAYEALGEDTAVGEATQALSVPEAALTTPAPVRAAVAPQEDTASTLPVEGLPTAIPPARAKRGKRWLWAVIGVSVLAALLVAAWLLGAFRLFTSDGRANLLGERAGRAADQGDFGEAADLVEQAYALDGGTWRLEYAAHYALRGGDLERAFGFMDQAVIDSNQDPYYLARRGYLYYRKGELEAALSDVDRALALNPDEYAATYAKGLILIASGQPVEGKLLLGTLEGVDLGEYDWPFLYRTFGHELRYDMARGAWALGEADYALELIAASLEEEAWWPEPYLLRAEIYQSQGNLGAARDDLLTALQIATDRGRDDLVSQIEQWLAELGTE